MGIKYPKKLIEVALPLDSINEAAAREKSIRHGHPSTLHLWWARRPLAACRAVLFAQMVNDPGGERGWGAYPGQTKAMAQKEREKLFDIIRDLVLWENTTNEDVLKRARKAIMESWAETCKLTGEDPKKLPPFLDPFSGGGSIPLEAQRLGLEAHGSDLNPVAVMIGKALIEIPPKFAGRKPIGPLPKGEKVQKKIEDWSGAKGLAEDVRRYGAWMRDEAFKRIGHLYPQVEITKEMVQKRPDLAGLSGQKLTVIAWLWARTVASPNPAMKGAQVPLISSYWLSTKKGKETWVEPVIDTKHHTYCFEIRTGKPADEAVIDAGTKLGRGANFKCLLSDGPIAGDYVKAEGKAGRMGSRLMAIVAEGARSRIYLEPTEEMERIAESAVPSWRPDQLLPINPRWFSPPDYGMLKYGDLFTPRQLTALTTFSDLVQETCAKILDDARSAGLYDDGAGLALGGHGPTAYADALDSRELASPCRGEVGWGAVPPTLLKNARNLRKNMTGAEKILWSLLRDKQLGDFKFRRQHPVDLYILDFYCPSARLAIELDGAQHAEDKVQGADADRTCFLNEKGIRVIRFWNNDVYMNIEGVLQKIWDELQPHPGPPQLGEGVKLADGGKRGVGDGLAEEGTGAEAYAEAVAVYLAFALSKCSEAHSTICTWSSAPKNELVVSTFRRQALPMTWDFAESNPFALSSGSWEKIIGAVCKVFTFSISGNVLGSLIQGDAQSRESQPSIISTDPPYYDNIDYADLSDFFYVWLRRSLSPIYPDLFSTMLVPKAEELVATPYRHGSKEQAETFFMNGMTRAIENMGRNGHPAFPVTIYYAFKQSDTADDATASTGWETFLAAVLKSGFAITGTWPMRTERDARSIGIGTNALASSIVLVCRKREPDAATISRKQFLRELQDTLPEALEAMIGGTESASPIAPVDLAQAAIGPGMGIFSKYAAVLDAEGQPMSVRTALTLINKAIDEYFSNVESSMDADTRFCVDWFQQYGFKAGAFGEADVLARAKGTSVDGVQKAGVVEAKSGNVRLYKLAEYPSDWDPRTDTRTPIWEALHHIIRTLRESESSAGKLLALMPDKTEQIRQLAYRLYTLCERCGWAEDARAYNELILTWPAILAASHQVGHHGTQKSLDLED